MKVDGILANLLQGISQQQSHNRLPGQCTNQLNAVNDVVDGWKRRPPTEFVANLLTSADEYMRWHFYDTGLEQYLVNVQQNGTLTVFDLLGNHYAPAGASTYKNLLSFYSPTDLSVVTIGDYTLLANSNTLPAMHVGNTEVYTNTALVYLKDGGEYGRKYRIYLDGVQCATYTAPGGSTPAVDAALTGTEYVAGQLLAGLMTNPEVLSKYTIKQYANVLEITLISGTSYIDVTVTDDRGGQFAKIIQRSVIKPGDLPKYATPGQIVQVTGEGTSDKDDYYLKFTIEHGAVEFGTEGVWRECAEPGLERQLDSNTMPLALIRLPDLSWTLTPLDGRTLAYSGGTFEVEHWRLRSAGSEETNRVPSFIGLPITFLGTFQDRMYMLSDETAVFSATNSYFNFFNQTAVTILDSDPVDMPSAGNTIVKLRRAVQHDKNLVIFADKAQFVIAGNKPLTPTDSMILTTSYESDLLTTPVAAGTSVLFPITYGDYAGVREFVTASANDTNSSQPITAHVPKLIPGRITQLVGNSNFDVVFVKGSEGANTIYVYKYLWQEGQRQQSAWGVWEFTGSVLTLFIKGAFIYIVLTDGLNVRLERIDLTDVPPEAMPYNVYLDSRTLVTPVGSTLAVPYTCAADTLVAVQGSTCKYPGAVIKVVSVAEGIATLEYAPTGACYVGVRFASEYEPTPPCIKDQNGGLVSNATFMLGNFMVSLRNTGAIVATVKNPHYPDFITEYTGRTLGALTNLIGAPVLGTGVFTVPVRKDAKATTLTFNTSSHLPMNITSIEWDGDYTKRGRRL